MDYGESGLPGTHTHIHILKALKVPIELMVHKVYDRSVLLCAHETTLGT